MPITTLALNLLLVFGQPDLGPIAVVGGDFATVIFDLPAGTPYQLNYSTGNSIAWFDSAGTIYAATDFTYVVENRGDFNGDHVLDARDLQGFTGALLDGTYDSRADFNYDFVNSEADIPGFIEALFEGYPAEGVVLHIEAFGPSASLGDAGLSLLTDPDQNGSFTELETRPVTLLEFFLPVGGVIGAPAEFYLNPAITPLVFTTNSPTRWEGHVPVFAGSPDEITVQ